MFMTLIALAASATSNPADAVEACRSITETDRRLACFDRTVAILSGARIRREIVLVDKTQIRDTRKRLFGFTLPNFQIFGGSDKDDAAEAVKQIEGTVATSTALPYGEYSLALQDGSIWRTTESVSGFAVHRGDTVVIKRAMFGYIIRNGAYSTRIQRTK